MRTALLLVALTGAAWGYGKLPVAFEPNRGQAPGATDYVARGQGYVLSLRPSRTELVSPGSRIATVLVGAKGPTRGEAEAPLPGVVHYLLGPDTSTWLADVPTYARVRYRGVYPGIDVVYYGNQGRLEYDFIVAPGADPRQIRLRYQGARAIHVDPAGDLLLETAAGSIRQHRPSIYQEADGVRREVAGRYVLRGSVVRFELARYDHAVPLVIDPALTWASYFGGGSDDGGQAVAVDSAGNVYIAGYTLSTAGDYDAFVSKLSPDAAATVYTMVLGGNGDDIAWALAVDSAGNAYFAGQTDSSNLPQSGYLNYYPGYSTDAFIAKLDTTGKLAYFDYLGGSGGEIIFGLALDSASNAYVVGATTSSDFPVSSGTAQTAYAGGIDTFVTKFDPTGKAVYSTYLGGGGDDYGNAIAADASGNVFITGSTTSANFPVTLSAIQPRIAGGTDAYVTKLSPSGTLSYSTYLGGSGAEGAQGIAIDSSGAAYVTGVTASADFPMLNAFQKTFGGSSDIFVAKVNGSGSSLMYSTYLGGSGDESGNAIAVDGAGNAYITGNTASTDFPVRDAFQASNQGSTNAVVAALNASGSALLLSSYLGGNGSANTSANSGDFGNAVSMSCSAGLVVVGTTSSSNFPATSGALRTSFQGGPFDAFVARIAAGGGTPVVASGGVVNSASSAAGPVAPGSLITIYGSNLAVATQTAPSTPWGINLGGAAVTINGAAAPIYYAAAGQMNVQLPYEVRTGTASLTVTAPCGTSVPVAFQVAQAAPYIFPAGDGWAITYPDGTLNGPNKPAHPGDVVIVYLTGIGPLDNAVATAAAAPATSLSRAVLPNTATIGGWTAPVQFLGLAPGFVGLAQANLVVPGLSPGTYSVVITVGGVDSNSAALYIQ